MITRRSFLAALGALPFVGKFLPKGKTFTLKSAGSMTMTLPAAPRGESYTIYTLVDSEGICARYDFERHAWQFHRQPKADLSNIEGVLSERTMTREQFQRQYPS